MKKMNWEYLGAFMDGEGCIVKNITYKYNPKMKKRYPCTTIRMEICNTDFDIMKDIFNFVKIGHLIDIKPRKKKDGTLGKPQIRWQTTHRQSYAVLKKLLPYMREKNKIQKAKEVIKFYEEKDSQ
jgi:hypothetical protein